MIAHIFFLVKWDENFPQIKFSVDFWRKMIYNPSMDHILNTLNDEQKRAVIHSGSPLLILAGAGTGKTRVITTKIAYLIHNGVDPRSILAVTFTKKAANEMRERACMLNPLAEKAQICTFHSFGAKFLRYYGEQDGISSNFVIYDEDDSVSLLRKAIPDCPKSDAKEFIFKIARAKDFCLSPDDDLSAIDSSPEFAAIYSIYETALRKTGNVDFGDLILRPRQILKKFPEIQQRISRRFSTIMVDEYQDSNVAQFELLQALNSPSTYLCVVGDDDQSIYKFRGAEIKNILSFPDQFAGTEKICLLTNYRSVEPILEAANKSIRNNCGRHGKELVSHRGPGEKPSVLQFENTDEETQKICQLIKEGIKQGQSYSDWAIIYRTNAQSRAFEQEFSRNKIPYKVFGNSGFFEREEVKDGLAYISVFLNPTDTVNFMRIINKPARKLGEKSLGKILSVAENKGVDYFTAGKEAMPLLSKDAQKGLNDFFEIFREAGEKIRMDRDATRNGSLFSETDYDSKERQTCLSEFVNILFEKSGLRELYQKKDEENNTDRLFNLEELSRLAGEYPATGEGLLQFLDNTNLDNTMIQKETSDDVVTLSTLHNTKGLEFGRVVISGLEQGQFPREDKTFDELEEERRLFYVGITRAKDKVIFTYCKYRRTYTGDMWYYKPSIFLKEVMGEDDEKSEDFSETKNFWFNNIRSTPSKSPWEREWPVGQRIFSDDYGYGAVYKHSYTEEGLIITVSFETGLRKNFSIPAEKYKLVKANDEY